ncbi:nucleoside triphosphate pyrophosphohydrolase [Brevibacillus fluminis]|uniref:Nucleoside triphosphate pyrophosphohydrolase n=1 Tax=Brevibacillus fluminis TaxID=511487 RepID=A0A3M8D4W6_9BACL|nr:nucleoside triphosphate pyrophosphohydrolase [Brevibacillus fluminis]RNB82759.1 nucleoside triphosphate pyrophosphohydrolase [Brevibacillus fluminis]
MAARIQVLGLGAGDLEQLPLGMYKQIKKVQKLYVRTKEHPVIDELIREGVQVESFDHVYLQHGGFDEVYEQISRELLDKAEQEQEILYAVPGHPLVAERTVQLLLEQARSQQVEIQVLGGQSFLDPLFARLAIDPIEGFALLDATRLTAQQINPELHSVIAQVYDQLTASDVKLTLMEVLPDEHPVTIVTAVGVAGMEHVETVPLYELDHHQGFGNLSLVYVQPTQADTVRNRQFARLREIVAILRSPEGCPWDREQTHQSLRKNLIEESFEVLEAIDEDDPDGMCEELGDLLLQVLLHSQIAVENGDFSIDDVILGLNEKLIRRHPHVFGERHADDANEAFATWQEVKAAEKAAKGIDPQELSQLHGIPRELPALMYAYKLQKKAAEVGFDWDNVADVEKKIEEEYEEVKQATAEERAGELGDLLFAVVNLARFYKVDPEEALRLTNRKFTRRFQFIEKKLKETGKTFSESSLPELDKWWDEAKATE